MGLRRGHECGAVVHIAGSTGIVGLDHRIINQHIPRLATVLIRAWPLSGRVSNRVSSARSKSRQHLGNHAIALDKRGLISLGCVRTGETAAVPDDTRTVSARTTERPKCAARIVRDAAGPKTRELKTK